MNERVDCFACDLKSAQQCQPFQRPPDASRIAIGGVRRVERDEMLYEIGTCPGLIGILRKGYLRRERLTPDGRRTVLGLVVPGRVVGEMHGWPAGYSLEAATEAEICLFSPWTARHLATDDAEFRRNITADLEWQYNHELTFAWLRAGLRCRERVIAFLIAALDLLPSETRLDGSRIVMVPVGRRDWADLCNTTVESISRHLADLSAEGLVEPLGGRRYRLPSVAALRDISGLVETPFQKEISMRMTAVNADHAIAGPSVPVRATVPDWAPRSQ